MKVLLFGQRGQLGRTIARAARSTYDVLGLDAEELDLTDGARVRDTIRTVRPDLIINAAAYTAVDRAESESAIAFAVNAEAPRIMAQEAERGHAGLIHFSTDYVFDGRKGTPYDEHDAPNPINAYGASKYEGEVGIRDVGGAHLILRTSWVYSREGTSFASKVVAWANTSDTLRIVDDQTGSPSWVNALTAYLLQVVARLPEGTVYAGLLPASGTYHLAGRGSATRLAWARAVVQYASRLGACPRVALVPGKTSDYPAAASRPENSSLDCSLFERQFFVDLTPWKSDVAHCFSPDRRTQTADTLMP